MPKQKNDANLPKPNGKRIQEKDSSEDVLAEPIKEAVSGLSYTSETDAEILPFLGTQAAAVTSEEVLKQSGSPPNAPVTEKDFNKFFAPLTQIQDWFGDEEKTNAQKFSDLKELLQDNIRDLKVFQVGRVELDIYVVGLDADNNLIGIKTKAVET